MNLKIVVVGLGYVGTSNAAVLAQHNEVIGVDILQARVDLINARQSTVVDDDLSKFLTTKNLDLRGTVDLSSAVSHADYVIVCTPTNYDEATKHFDTSSVLEVIKKVIKIKPDTCIVVKSTVPVGFVKMVQKKLNTDAVIFSPEFLREGRALYDILHPERIVVGERSRRAEVFAALLKKGAVAKNIETIFTGSCEAESIKLFANTYLAMRVAFFNELDSFALARGFDSRSIIEGVSMDTRIGNYYNNPSFGYGGYCLPKDTKQLLANYEAVPQNLISAIIQSNNTRQDFLTSEILTSNPKTVGVYRLIMKTGSDNFRESAIQGIISRLLDKGLEVIVYEPDLLEKRILNSKIEKNLNTFKNTSDVIIANRLVADLDNVSEKVFSRDIFRNN